MLWQPARDVPARLDICGPETSALDVDCAQLQKIYGAPNDAEMRRNSPAKYNADMKVVSGNPDSQACQRRLR